MPRKDEYATVVHLRDETLEELLKAVQFYKQMEKDLDRDPEENSMRLPNMKFDRDLVLRKVLREFNERNNDDDDSI